jgi:hypothetical protein
METVNLCQKAIPEGIDETLIGEPLNIQLRSSGILILPVAY